MEAPTAGSSANAGNDNNQGNDGQASRGNRNRPPRGPRGGANRGRGGQRNGQWGGKAPEGGRAAAAQQLPPTVPIEVAKEVGKAPDSKSAAGGSAGGSPVEDDEHGSGKDCFICANTILYSSIAPCKHVTCHICSLRMRALYKNKKCPHCRTPSDYVIFTEDDTKQYSDFDKTEFVCVDENLGVKFETQKIYEDVRLLLQYNCPDSKCAVACLSWDDLQRHVASAHQRVLCNLCVEHKHCFAHEHSLFTTKELRKHEKFGDDKPGSVDQSGFTGHPECGFCRKRFYTSDELYTHCREKHERCFICDRRSAPGKEQLFEDYRRLEDHFRNAHFMCQDARCQEERFVVFESEIDLKAHQLEKHPEGMSKNALKDARRVDMTNFDVGPSRHERGRRGRGGGGRGGRMAEDYRNDGHNPPQMGSDTPMPLRRDELAFQRAMAVQSASGSRAFGGQLTEPTPAPRPPPAARPAPNARPTPAPVVIRTTNSQTAPAITRETDFPSLSAAAAAAAAGPSNPAPNIRAVPPAERPRPLTDEEIKARHLAVIERASTFVKGDKRKVDAFKGYVSEYRNNGITAKGMVDKFWHLFGVTAADLGTLMRELAELFDDENKKAALLKAWNSWRAENERFPPMSVASSSIVPQQTSRVLRVKSSTAPSRGPWDVSSTVASSKKVPAISASNSSTNLASRNSSSINLAARTAGPSSYRPAPAPIKASPSEFPSLPAAPKRQPINGFGPIKSKGPVPTNAWSASRDDVGEGSSEQNDEDSSNNQRKKGKGKQTLFRFG